MNNAEQVLNGRWQTASNPPCLSCGKGCAIARPVSGAAARRRADIAFIP